MNPDDACSSMSEDFFLDAARQAVTAAEEAQEAAVSEGASEKVRKLTEKALEEARNVLISLQTSPRVLKERRRQSIKEFTSMLGEEVVEESFQYAERTVRKAKSLIEDHFQIDEAFRMLGPMRQNANFARDVHDWFNLLALIPVCLLNFHNWHCKEPLRLCGLTQGKSMTELWSGTSFETFWWTTCAYFVVDLLWMLAVPTCVRSPGVIIKHHIATIGYIIIPYMQRRVAWIMGACMLVEVNTWFLIARRSFNKNGDKPFQAGVPLSKSIRLLVVSLLFYITWFAIRLGFYPYLLPVIVWEWYDHSQDVGTYFNWLLATPLMQCIFIFLNIKWTIDLIRSKAKGRRASKGL